MGHLVCSSRENWMNAEIKRIHRISDDQHTVRETVDIKSAWDISMSFSCSPKISHCVSNLWALVIWLFVIWYVFVHVFCFLCCFASLIIIRWVRWKTVCTGEYRTIIAVFLAGGISVWEPMASNMLYVHLLLLIPDTHSHTDYSLLFLIVSFCLLAHFFQHYLPSNLSLILVFKNIWWKILYGGQKLNSF